MRTYIDSYNTSCGKPSHGCLNAEEVPLVQSQRPTGEYKSESHLLLVISLSAYMAMQTVMSYKGKQFRGVN